jgi:PAS domain S-box-containing protein
MKKRMAATRNRDIADRKGSEEALRESEERYRVLIDTAPEAILVHSEGKVLYANQAAVELYGAANLDDLKAHNIMNLVPLEDVQVAAERLRLLQEGRRPPPREAAIIRLDGKKVPVDVVSFPVHYGGMRAIQVILRDITEAGRREDRPSCILP